MSGIELHPVFEENLAAAKQQLEAVREKLAALTDSAAEWSKQGAEAAVSDARELVGPRLETLREALQQLVLYLSELFERYVDEERRAQIAEVSELVQQVAESSLQQLRDAAATVSSGDARELASAYVSEQVVFVQEKAAQLKELAVAKHDEARATVEETAAQLKELAAAKQEDVRATVDDVRAKVEGNVQAAADRLADLKTEAESLQASVAEWRAKDTDAALADLQAAIGPQVRRLEESVRVYRARLVEVYEEQVDEESRAHLEASVEQFHAVLSQVKDTAAEITSKSVGEHSASLREAGVRLTALASDYTTPLYEKLPKTEDLRATFDENLAVAKERLATLKREVEGVQASAAEWSAKGTDAALADLKAVIDPRARRVAELIAQLSEWTARMYATYVDEDSRARLEEFGARFKEVVEGAGAHLQEAAARAASGDAKALAQQYVASTVDKLKVAAATLAEPHRATIDAKVQEVLGSIEQVQDVVTAKCPGVNDNVKEIQSLSGASDRSLPARAFLISLLLIETVMILLTTGLGAAKKTWYKPTGEAGKTEEAAPAAEAAAAEHASE
eukprot:Rhum_TRINITY_DN14033_c0_g1::Rhum_TRINITY_DN14033_c0_g1_i4::g.67499::m.67499